MLYTVSGDPVLVAVVSDGAGSAERGEVGAHLACSLLITKVKALLELNGTVRDVTHDFAADWVTRFQNEVGMWAEIQGLQPRDFACTTLAAIVGNDCAAFLQIGDGV